MGEQLDIFGALAAKPADDPSPKAAERPSIDQRFEEFCADNPHVIAEMLRLAREKLDRGERRVGVKALWEELRSWLKVTGQSDYKLNNDFTAPAARKLVELEPRLAGVIEMRRRKGEATP